MDEMRLVSQEAIDEMKRLCEENNKITARDMFEEMEFEFSITEYKIYKPDYNYVDEDGNAIMFDLENKKINIATNTAIKIENPQKFVKAINKQIEELGWDNE